jgi:S-adenosylmethionine:tRNA ribosyltransferase-isomerase
LPARVMMKKETGGNVIVLFLPPGEKSIISAVADRKIELDQKIFFGSGDFIKVVGQKGYVFSLEFNFSRKKLYSLLKKYGSMPIPLYLKKSPLKQDQLLEKYQTIFAKHEGSSAAPTASLHFTNRLFKKLKKKGIKNYFITLHVGLGTFASVTRHNLKAKKLHEEYFEVDQSVLRAIERAKDQGKKLVAAGTTVVRTLESVTRSRPLQKKQAQTIIGNTDLFIYPPYNFKMVDHLITNFHLPKSSLMMLVEAFLQHKKAKKSLIELYNIAIKNKFRFYSFGDAMLIL